MRETLTNAPKNDTLTADEKQLVKLMRRLQALPDGRHEIILTVQQDRVQDWTVRQIGKVER